MKSILILTVFSSLNVMAACPDLSGRTASCRSVNGKLPGNFNQVITQETQNDVTTYTMTYEASEGDEATTQILIADGKSRRETEVDPDSGISLVKVTTMTCKDNALIGHTTAFIDGQFLGIMDSKTTKSGNVITTELEGALFGRDVEDVVICK